VRQHYFSELTRQIARIGGEDAGLALGIFDHAGAEVVSTGSFVDTSLVSRRPFPVAFFDPIIASVNAPAGLSAPQWTVQVSGAADPALAAATRGADISVGVAAMAAIALVVALVLSVRAVRAGAELAEMRADFLSSITHELKTPIAAIRALGDTMVTGRTPNEGASREYAGLIVQESKRLARLVENLLAHARITDIADVYSFEPLDVDELVRNALRGFQQQLAGGAFTVDVDVPPDLTQIRADRTAMELVLDNLIDNAIRYSDTGRHLIVTARDEGAFVAIVVQDRGVGLATADIERVTRKFVRGRNAPPGGSGLGLAIVKRIVTDHHGTLDIASTLGEGTSVTCRLPKSES
jgi:two-component system phosphate regulon sensor histidine kinase PhoR